MASLRGSSPHLSGCCLRWVPTARWCACQDVQAEAHSLSAAGSIGMCTYKPERQKACEVLCVLPPSPVPASSLFDSSTGTTLVRSLSSGVSMPSLGRKRNSRRNAFHNFFCPFRGIKRPCTPTPCSLAMLVAQELTGTHLCTCVHTGTHWYTPVHNLGTACLPEKYQKSQVGIACSSSLSLALLHGWCSCMTPEF